jgi:hypothetical protein
MAIANRWCRCAQPPAYLQRLRRKKHKRRLDPRFSMDPDIHLPADADCVSILIDRAQVDLFAGYTLQLRPDVA